jgi:hypothetical protein
MDTYGHLFPASNDRAELEAGRHRSGAQADNGKLSFLHRIEPRHQPSVAVMPITP